MREVREGDEGERGEGRSGCKAVVIFLGGQWVHAGSAGESAR